MLYCAYQGCRGMAALCAMLFTPAEVSVNSCYAVHSLHAVHFLHAVHSRHAVKKRLVQAM